MTGEEEGRTCEGLGLVGLQRADEVPSDVRGQLAAHDHRCKLACVHPGGYKQAYLLCLLYELLHIVLAKVALAGVVARLHV